MANMWVVFLILGIALLLVVALLSVAFTYVRNYWTYLRVPHEKPKTLMHIFKVMSGSLTTTEDEEVEHYSELYSKFKGSGPFCGFYELLQPRVLVLDRDLVKQILIKDFSNFNDRGIYHNCEKDPLSADLYNRRGNCWKDMRIKLDPLFEKYHMSYLYDSLFSESHRLIEAFEDALQQRTHEAAVVLNIQQLVRRYVLGTIANCVFGIDSTKQREYPLDDFDTMTQLALTTRRHGTYMTVLLCRYQGLGKRLGYTITGRKVRAYFENLITDIVSRREKFNVEKQDYMQLIINVRDQELNTHATETVKDDKELKEHLFKELMAHAFVFVKTGFEPTMNTLSYVLYELALHQDIQDRVRDEVNEALSKNNNEFNYGCINMLKYMGQVISETIRMHPIQPFLVRRTLSDYAVPDHPNYIMRKDTYVIIPTHAMHNDPEIFNDPHRFDPERFSRDFNKTRDQCQWMGFGEGPRVCIGIHFAQLQLRIGLAQLITKYRFTQNYSSIMIKLRNDIALHVERINEPSARDSRQVEGNVI